MFKCPVCGSIGQNDKVCLVCGRCLSNTTREPLPSSLVPEIRDPPGRAEPKQSKPYWTATKLVILTGAFLVAISAVATGVYYDPTRTSSPLCTNGAVNYPSCNSCCTTGEYNLSRQSCYCTNGAHNPPSCNNYCANNAINPPSCDLCRDNRTDVPCPPQAVAETDTVTSFSAADRTQSLVSGYSPIIGRSSGIARME